MKKSALLPAVLAAALFGAIGFGAGMVVGTESVPASSADSAVVGDTSRDGDDGTAADGSTPEPATTSSRRDAKKARRSKTVSLAAALPSIDVPALAVGEGEITGHVHDADGKGIEGVTVRLSPKTPRRLLPDGRPEAEIPPAELIEAYARRVLYARTNRVEIHTDGDGAFRAAGLNGETTYALSALKDGLSIAPKDPVGATRAKIGQVIDFVAKPSVRLEVRVALPDGMTPEWSSLQFSRGSGGKFNKHWSERQTAFDLAPDTYEVFALAGEDQEFKSKPTSVELTAGEEPEVLELVLGGRPGLKGSLSFEEPEGSQMLYVWAARVDAGTEMDGPQLKNTGTRVQAWATQGFKFRFQDLSPGTYVVGASRTTKGEMDVLSDVTVGEGPTEHDLVVPRLDPSKYFTLNAVGPDGKRVDVKSVRLSYRGGRRNSSRNGQLLKLPDGTLRVLHMTVPSNVKDARLYATANSPTHGMAIIEYRRESVTEITIQFSNPATLALTVTGHEKTRYADAIRVSLSRVVKEGESSRYHSAGNADFKGKTENTFTGLQPGTYWAYLYVGLRRRVNVGRQHLELGPGENKFTFEVPQLSQLTVYGAQRYVRATRTSGGDRVRVNGVAGNERWVIDLLPPGTYEIRDGRGRKQTIALPGTSEVRF